MVWPASFGDLEFATRGFGLSNVARRADSGRVLRRNGSRGPPFDEVAPSSAVLVSIWKEEEEVVVYWMWGKVCAIEGIRKTGLRRDGQIKTSLFHQRPVRWTSPSGTWTSSSPLSTDFSSKPRPPHVGFVPFHFVPKSPCGVGTLQLCEALVNGCHQERLWMTDPILQSTDLGTR